MTKIRISVENLNQSGGLFTTPVWVAAHDGDFDIFDAGQEASAGLEAIAEDGNIAPLSEAFAAQQPNGEATVVVGAQGVAGPIDPTEQAQATLEIDDTAAQRYLSYSAMIIPSNDAFIGNDDAKEIELFDENGNFNGATSFVIAGDDVYDAGTEVNTEQDAAFINQTAPNTGIDENGVVSQHQGFNGSEGHPGGEQIILGGTVASGDVIDPAAGDFTQDGFELLKFHINQVNEISGSKHSDVILGDDRDDIVHAGRGHDLVLGQNGYDDLYGQNGNDILVGGNGNDLLDGGNGKDFLAGGNDNDRLFGGKGKDVLVGGNGNDYLDGGKGRDTLIGGEGYDTFNFDNTDNFAEIMDFTKGEDVIELALLGIDSFVDIFDNARVIIDDGYTKFNFDSHDTLIVHSDGLLDANDFSFA